ncbi:hypothetical protein INR49_013184 [Caranx melampygus]|nr:hypothetical protein INR49_013184 [Caranx melampygus]
MGCLLWWWLRPEAKRISFKSMGPPPRVRTTTWSPRLLPSSTIQERTYQEEVHMSQAGKSSTHTPGEPLDREHPPTSMTVSYGVSE